MTEAGAQVEHHLGTDECDSHIVTEESYSKLEVPGRSPKLQSPVSMIINQYERATRLSFELPLQPDNKLVVTKPTFKIARFKGLTILRSHDQKTSQPENVEVSGSQPGGQDKSHDKSHDKSPDKPAPETSKLSQ